MNDATLRKMLQDLFVAEREGYDDIVANIRQALPAMGVMECAVCGGPIVQVPEEDRANVVGDYMHVRGIRPQPTTGKGSRAHTPRPR